MIDSRADACVSGSHQARQRLKGPMAIVFVVASLLSEILRMASGLTTLDHHDGDANRDEELPPGQHAETEHHADWEYVEMDEKPASAPA
eukprot:scaffold38771_cov38-Prasinocladus_malaysianus.AAC.2